MRQNPNPLPNGSAAAVRATPVTREAVAAPPLKPLVGIRVLPLVGIRVLQNRGAPAQLSLFQRALPGR